MLVKLFKGVIPGSSTRFDLYLDFESGNTCSIFDDSRQIVFYVNGAKRFDIDYDLHVVEVRTFYDGVISNQIDQDGGGGPTL